MNKALITVQAGQLSKQKIAQLNLMLKQHYRRFVCDTKLQTVWCVVPTGQAFTKYELSRSSLLTIECPNGFEQRKRISMLKACERDWVAITGLKVQRVLTTLIGFPASWAMEGGEILPEPGEEETWLQRTNTT